MESEKSYTPEEVYNLIVNYRSNLIAANNLKNEYIEIIAGGGVAQYGIDAAMPKGSSSPGDPTFNEINRLIKQDSMIDRLEEKVRFIQNRWHRVEDDHHAVVFNLILSGRSFQYVSEVVGKHRSSIKKTLMEVAVVLADES